MIPSPRVPARNLTTEARSDHGPARQIPAGFARRRPVSMFPAISPLRMRASRCSCRQRPQAHPITRVSEPVAGGAIDGCEDHLAGDTWNSSLRARIGFRFRMPR